MAPRTHPIAQDRSDSEDEAPETLNAAQSKSLSRGQEETLQRHHARQKEGLKERNRARDARLKANAGSRKVKEGQSTETKTAEKDGEVTSEDDGGEQEENAEDMARVIEEMEVTIEQMRRNMKALEEEYGEDDDNVEDDYMEEPDDDDNVSASGNDMDDDEDEDEEGSGESDNAAEMDTIDDSTRANADHLPDHLFTTAFAQKPGARTRQSTRPSTSSRKLPAKAERTKKRKKSSLHPGPKQVVVGGRTMVVLRPDSSTKPTSHQYRHALQPAKSAKFVNATLKLDNKPSAASIPARVAKGGKAKKPSAVTWERRAANVGVAKRTIGPAANFARHRS